MKDPDLIRAITRLSIAHIMENTEKHYFYCRVEYANLDDVIEKNVVLVKWPETQEEKTLVACSKCYKENNRESKYYESDLSFS